jgi:hypothetical protein
MRVGSPYVTTDVDITPAPRAEGERDGLPFDRSARTNLKKLKTIPAALPTRSPPLTVPAWLLHIDQR